jgi:hypothetical protein
MVKMMLKRISIGVFLLITVLSRTVYGARFPNAIEKKIVLTGEAAISLAELFALPSSGQSSVSLQLGRRDAWAVYLLKQDTKEQLSNDNNGSPARYNTVEFSMSSVPYLTISPYWLDLGTQRPEPKAGYYSFSSPFISEKLDLNDPWTQLLRRLMKEYVWDRNAMQHFQGHFKSLDGVELSVWVFGAKDYPNNVERNGYCVVIEAHSKNAYQ